MEEADLRKRLADLHQELESGPAVDQESKQLLEALTQDIRRVLEPDVEAHEHATLTDRLAESVRSFEESHPQLAAALGRVADTLSNLGI